MLTSRPVITAITSAAELKRWYWTKEELSLLAAHLGIATSGSKAHLTGYLCNTLDDVPTDNTVRPPKRKAAPQLQPPVGRETIIPVGQRSSQVLRHFFAKEIGKQFH